VSRGKPAPDLFLLAANKLNVLPGYCTVLEDSEAGIIAAHAAGMRSLMVPDIKPATPAISNLANKVFPTLIEVHQFLAREYAAAQFLPSKATKY
jgi:beta-phosphoglucomutase-like phosphatase (HAD superfamily)